MSTEKTPDSANANMDTSSEEVSDGTVNDSGEIEIESDSATDETTTASAEEGDAIDEDSVSEVEEIDPIELFDLPGAKDHIFKLRARLSSAMDERDTAREKVNELGSRLKSLSEAYQRKGDEVTKAKERLERQSKFKEDRRRGEVVSSLFEPYENLKRSIDAIEKAGVDPSHIEGLRIVSLSFMGAFNTLGLEEVPGVGSSFDPNVHEALMMHEVNDPTLKDTVIQVFAAGYRIGDLVLRPAKVIVGAYNAPPEPEVVSSTDEEDIPSADIDSGDEE